MSDAGRKDFTDKLGEKITPQSEKTTFEKVKESVTDAADNLAGKVQPDASKGDAQHLFDSAKKN